VLVPAALMLESQGGLSAQILHYLRSLSPVAAALSLLRPHLAEFGGRPGGLDPLTGEAITGLLPAWQVFLPFAGGLILICLIVLIFVLRRPPTGSEGFGADAEKQRSLARRVMFLIDPKKQRKPVGRFNPLMVKESLTNQLRSGRWMIRIFYGALFISMGLALMALYGGQTEHGDLLRYVAAVLVAFQVGVIAMVAPSLTSPAVSSEIENSTFETLRLTPLRSGQIFWGKFIPAFVPALLPIVALLPAYGAICFVNETYIRAAMLLLPVFILTVILCCTTGLFCSTLVTSTARATVSSYLIIAGLIVLPLLAWLASGQQLDPRLARWLALPSPLVMSLNLLPDAPSEMSRLWPQHLMLIGGICLAMLVLARLRLTYLLRKG
jgi:ABC-type transport system involved in multi-copper enzyme maturation permease subunit